MDYRSLNSPHEWIPLHLRDNLSFLHILGIAASNLTPSILWMVAPAFFEPLSTKLHISKMWKTLILFGASLSGFIVGPLAGVYSDACAFKYGRRRIYMAISVFLLLIGMLMMCYCYEIGQFFQPDNPLALQKFLFGFSYEFVMISGSIMYIPARSLCSDVCPLHQQNLMANICSFFAGFGGVIINVIGGFKLFEYTPLNQEQFMLIISGILCVISTIISIIVTPEEPVTIKPSCVNPFKETLKAIKIMPKPIRRVLPSMLFSQIAYFEFSLQFNHFMGHDIFKGDNSDPSQYDMVKRYNDGVAWSMFCGAMRYLSQSIFGIVNPPLIDKFGYKWNTFFGYFCMTIGEALFFIIDNKYAYLFIPVLIGFGYGVELTVPFAVASICAAVYNQNIGAYFGILNTVFVLGEQIANFGIGSGLSLLWGDNSRLMIAVSSIYAAIATGLSFLVVEPSYNKDSLASLATMSTDNSAAITTDT